MSQIISSFHYPNEDRWRDADEARREQIRWRREREDGTGFMPSLGPDLPLADRMAAHGITHPKKDQ